MSSSQSDYSKAFSIRIVSLDYNMAPPIPDLDFCYSTFQGRSVEEVPVIRIYGSTPAGQKACLHVHRALPYLYVPCPDVLLQNPEEGHAYIHALSHAVEKALRYRSTSGSKRQHVHACNLVRAKKFYGYHSSEGLFVKIYLYYPHEVARVATLLLGGAILNRNFQPYESHIPYLLQFLVDYNLYGMSHLHTCKVKFRPPLPVAYIPREDCYKKHANHGGEKSNTSTSFQADSSNDEVGHPALWLSSTVPSVLVWPVPATVDDGTEDKTTHLVRRQSICELEGDSSVDDIVNEKFKIYTSLSQARSEVKMVQSLIPIWEEEYERSGMQEPLKSPDCSKPFPENVLRSFLHGLEYENALSELCKESQNSFPSKVAAQEEDERLDKYLKSFTDIGKSVGVMEHPRPLSPCGNPLNCLKEENKHGSLSHISLSKEDATVIPYEKIEFHGLASAGEKSLSSESIETADSKRIETEALGLLSWLASSQVVEDLSTDDELIHEAILSPLLPTKTYEKALEKAQLDYESASQQECQDILDSVEGDLKSKGLKEQASCDGDHQYVLCVSSGKVIPQVDGSSNDQFRAPQEGFPSEINMNDQKEKSSLQPVEKYTTTRLGSKRSGKHLWGSLPFFNKQKEHEDSDLASLNSSGDVGTKNDTDVSSSSGNIGNRSCDALKTVAGTETSGEKAGKMLSKCSVRDLMRRRRFFRAEESESEKHIVEPLSEVQMNAVEDIHLEGPVHTPFVGDRPYIMAGETPQVDSSLTDQDGIGMERITCSTMSTPAVCSEGYKLRLTDQMLQSNINLNEHLSFHEGSSDREGFKASAGSRCFKEMALSVPHMEPIEFPEAFKLRHLGTAISSELSGYHKGEKSDSSHSLMKRAADEVYSCKKKLFVGSQSLKSNVLNHQSVDEGLQDRKASSSSSPASVRAECPRLRDANNYDNYQDYDIDIIGLPEMHFDRCDKSKSALDNLNGKRDIGTCSSGHEWKSHRLIREEKISMEYIEMTFSRKPPSIEQIDMTPEEFPGTGVRIIGGTDNYDGLSASNSCFMDSKRQEMDGILPFFQTNFEDGNSLCRYKETCNFHEEAALGVPTHFQNDGSVLYLLTHAFSPPSLDCVCQWLLEMATENSLNDATGVSKASSHLPFPSSMEYNDCSSNGSERVDLCLSEKRPTHPHKIHEISSTNLLNSSDACYGVPPKPNAAVVLEPILDQSSQANNTHEPENFPAPTGIITREPPKAAIYVKEKLLTNNWQEISQISGPEDKSKLTPLSQIGFRDPASVGGGQQLTLISLEVQAESRGDLRPHPRYDAINVVALAIQEDTSNDFEMYVLMRGNYEESCRRNVDGVSGCKFVISSEEKHLLDHFVKIISSYDPDVLMGWEVQGSSLGFLAERAAHLGISLLKNISRIPAYETKLRVTDIGNGEKGMLDNVFPEASVVDSVFTEDAIIEDEWGRTHASGIHVGGRIVLNIWRLMRAEVKLNIYTAEAVAEEVLRRKIPSISCRILNQWFSSGPGRARFRCIEYVIERAKLNLQIMNQLDMINRTSELARVFGIDFFSVLSRGSQFRVESMLLRLAHSQNYLAISPGNHQVASQPAMECLPLVMEPESGLYVDPVVVLDFQSLYPSMIIAYNLCFCTCLGKVIPSTANVLGVSSFTPDPQLLMDIKQQLLLTPNGVMYVPTKVRKGVLPRMLEEILSTRIMVKQAMKKLMPSQRVLQRIFNARQLALKLISNVTYGYTAAGFSGRMPCAELADSIVQCGRRTLETAISFVNEHPKWKARVIYGDTDSMFVILKGRSKEEAFRIGQEIASAVTAMNPYPVTLKMEKVYRPCFLLTKKRYVGYSYESPDQEKPTFDAKGIETVRRDTCAAVAKALERSIRIIFEHQDISEVKSYLQRQWTRILSGKVSLQDFVFAKEVRLGNYSARASSLPPAAIVATKAMRADPRAEPHYGERVPYVVVHGEPGARLIDMVVDPADLLEINSPYRLNDLYYITKQIIPALQRVFGLLGADLNQWFSEMPRPVRQTWAKRHSYASHSWSLRECDDNRLGISNKVQAKRRRIDTYYTSKHCIVCDELVQASAYLCDKCSNKRPLVATAVVGKTSKLEREIQHLTAICRHCGGGDWITESGVKCTSLACSVFYERRKIQKELQALSTSASTAGFYPSCMAEWF